MDKVLKFWRNIYQYFIPSITTIMYIIYVWLIQNDKIIGKILQQSVDYGKMLETVVTFLSIVLSVFGFLIPSFLSSKGSSLMIQFFLENADIEYFIRNLKNIVACGLIEVILTCLLLLADIVPSNMVNCTTYVWLWLLIYFLCSSYRFICILIRLMMKDKKDTSKVFKNEITRETNNDLKSKLKRI